MYKIKVDDNIYTIYNLEILPIQKNVFNKTTKEIDVIRVGWRLVASLVGGEKKTLTQSTDYNELVQMINKIWTSKKDRVVLTKGVLHEL